MIKEENKNVARFFYIIGTVLIIVLIGIFDPNLGNAFDALKRVNLVYILFGFASVLLFWISDGLLLHYITSFIFGRVSFLASLKVGIIGLYYGALTPFASGGQPAQVLYMKRNNIPYGISMCIVLVKFIVFELSLCLFYTIAMIFRGGYFFNNYKQVFWFTTLGFVINLSAVILILFIIINENIPYKIGYGIVRLLSRFKFIKKPEKAYKSIDKNINDFHSSVKYIIKYKFKVIVSVLLSIANLGFLFAIPYFIYLAFGHTAKSMIDVITMQSFLSLAVSFFPLPGASVASEGAFYLFFSSYFTKVPVFIAMIIWRFMSYYLVLIAGCILIVIDEVTKIRKKRM